MALIKCSECGKEISDKAKVCVNCGCPIKKEKKNSNKIIATIIKTLLLCLFIFISAMMLDFFNINEIILSCYYGVGLLISIIYGITAIIMQCKNTYNKKTNRKILLISGSVIVCLFLIIIVIMPKTFVNNNNKLKNEIIGTWYWSKTENVDGENITDKSILTFYKDGTAKENIILIINNKVIYDVDLKETWIINEAEYIALSSDNPEDEIRFIKYNESDDKLLEIDKVYGVNGEYEIKKYYSRK